MPSGKTVFDVAVSLVMVTAAGLLVWPRLFEPEVVEKQEPRLVIPANPVDVTGRPAIGLGARVALLEFTDVQCPYCARFEQEILPILEADYISKGLLTLYTLHFPLPSHSTADDAAELAHCAHLQGKFRPVLGELFRLGAAFDVVRTPGEIATKLGVDGQSLNACAMAGTARSVVEQDIGLGRRLGIRGTPGFFVGVVQSGGRVSLSQGMAGLRSLDEFRAAIEALLPVQ